MNKVAYIERKNFVKFDDEHYVLYLNEERAEVSTGTAETGEMGETVQGYAYTGNMPDGGTLIEAKDVNDTNRRARFVAGLIGTEYDLDAQIAILVNGNHTPQCAEELAAFEENRYTVKKAIDELLAREL